MESMQSQAQQLEETPPSAEEHFVVGVLQICQVNKGLAARLRRADDPASEYQSWELLAAHGVDLEQPAERFPFVTVAAAIAKARVSCNGYLGLGRAIAACYEQGNASEQAKARLRRLLACDDLAELCRTLRPLFSLIDSKVGQGLDYVRLLKQLRQFELNAQQVRVQWAQDFYRYAAAAEAEERA